MTAQDGRRDAASYVFRVPIAAVLYVLTSSWVVRHFGLSLDKAPWIGAIIATASTLYGLVGAESKGGWPARVRAALQFAIGRAVLATIALLLFLAGTFISSVRVTGGSPGQMVSLLPRESDAARARKA